MRLIDADAAKEKLCTMCRWEGTSNCDECEHPIDDMPSIDAVKYTDDEIQRMQDIEQAQIQKAYDLGYAEGKADAELQWIPCSKRMPEESEQTYWCCSETGYQFQCRWTNNMYGFGATEYSKWGWHVMDKPQYSTVIAWMPLPKPYEAERKES